MCVFVYVQFLLAAYAVLWCLYVCVEGEPRNGTFHSCCRRFITNYASQLNDEGDEETKRSFYVIVPYICLLFIVFVVVVAVSL